MPYAFLRGWYRVLVMLLLLNPSVSCWAAKYAVKGEVRDSVGDAEIYATVRVYAVGDTARTVALGTTGENGEFVRELPGGGKYRLTVASVGKEMIEREFAVEEDCPVADLGVMVSREASHELGQVEVVAQRPLVVREIDRLGYDVKADPEASTQNLREMLRKVPLVTVDDEGNIRVKGSSDFKIYKNGRPNNSFTKNAKDIFAAIPASSIKKIEVITEPGAREDAEGVGVILNIVTDNETALKGVVGTAYMYLDNHSYIPSPSVWVSTQMDKVTVALNVGYGRTPKGPDARVRKEQWSEYYETGNRYEAETTGVNTTERSWGGIEASWEPDTMNLVTVEANYWFWRPLEQNMYNTVRMWGAWSEAEGGRPLLYGYHSVATPYMSRYLNFDGAVNYQRSTGRKGETLTLSYRLSTEGQSDEQETSYYDMVDCLFDYTGIYSDSKMQFMEHTAQADWSRQYGEHHKLDVGAKGIFRSNHTENAREYRGTDVATFDDFTHHTSIAAAYADYRLSLGKWSVRAGMRYEYSYLSARFKAQREGQMHPDFSARLSDWVPNAAVSWTINDANSLKVSYNRSIRRPGIGFLDPSVTETPTSVSFGNPDLRSVAYNNASFNYSLILNKFTLDFNLSGTYVDNSLQTVQYLDDLERVVTTYDNVGRMWSGSGSVYFQWSIDSKTRWMLNLWGGYTQIRQPVGVDASGRQLTGRRGQWQTNPWTQVTRKLPWNLDVSVSAFWWSGSLSNVYSYSKSDGAKGIGYAVSLVKKLLKDDRLTVSLTARNPFGPSESRFLNYTFNPEYRAESVSMNFGRQYVGLGVNFRFGSLSAQVKKTARSISNDDLEKSGK